MIGNEIISGKREKGMRERVWECGLRRKKEKGFEIVTDPVLDQANMYSVRWVAMVMGEMADMAETVKMRLNRNFDMEDIHMDELEQEVEEIQDRMRDDHDWIIQLQEENGDLQNRNNVLFGCLEALEVRVQDLMAFRMVWNVV